MSYNVVLVTPNTSIIYLFSDSSQEMSAAVIWSWCRLRQSIERFICKENRRKWLVTRKDTCMCTVHKQLSELTKRTPIKFFIIGAQESTEYTVFSNLRQEGQEIPNLNLLSLTQVTCLIRCGTCCCIGFESATCHRQPRWSSWLRHLP